MVFRPQSIEEGRGASEFLDWKNFDYKGDLTRYKHHCEQHKCGNIEQCIRNFCIVLCECCGFFMFARKGCDICEKGPEDGINIRSKAREANGGKIDEIAEHKMWSKFSKARGINVNASWKEDMEAHSLEVRKKYWDVLTDAMIAAENKKAHKKREEREKAARARDKMNNVPTPKTDQAVKDQRKAEKDKRKADERKAEQERRSQDNKKRAKAKTAQVNQKEVMQQRMATKAAAAAEKLAKLKKPDGGA